MENSDTSSFYLDGSHKEDLFLSIGFVSREKPYPINWEDFDTEIDWNDDVEVELLRGCMFFHAQQIEDKDGKRITLGKLREFFTSKAIKLLEKDGYIKLIIDHGEPE